MTGWLLYFILSTGPESVLIYPTKEACATRLHALHTDNKESHGACIKIEINIEPPQKMCNRYEPAEGLMVKCVEWITLDNPNNVTE